VRIRHALEKPAGGGDRFLWRRGSTPLLYGLDRLDGSQEVVIAEGESDCHTLWHHGVAAVGLPGAAGWRDDRDAGHLDGIERIYVVVEPDAGGDAVMGWLARSAINDRVWVVELGEYKDPSLR
jgi:DNA primase